MANSKDLQKASQAVDIKAEIKALMMKGALTQAKVAENGDVTLKENLSTLKVVDVADVDLLLTFANGDHVIITNGALDALSVNPPDAIFIDKKINVSDLFKLVGIANPAKAGSLRLVSENIDANPLPEQVREEIVESLPAPPAPIMKVNAGIGPGKGPGLGIGVGSGEGEVPATVVPLVTPPQSVYRIGITTQTVQDILQGDGFGVPNVKAALYTSTEFKVTPSGRADAPLGSYDPNGSTEQLAQRASPANQSLKEVINGTSGADTINFNSAFSASEGQWSKDLHVDLNNFSNVSSIQIVFNAAKIAQIPGFDLIGPGVTRDAPTSNSWHVTPNQAMLFEGFDVSIVYDISDGGPSVDFGADVTVLGNVSAINVEVVENLLFTWRNVESQTEFIATNSTGQPLMVLPSGGVGVQIFAGDGNDVINAGAGPDVIHGGAGDDTINAGVGNDILDGGTGADILNGGVGADTATYENATAGVIANLDANLASSPHNVINTGEAAGDTYNSIEFLKGSNFDDILIGDAQSNAIYGLDGNDVLISRGGFDLIDGGAGNDTASYQYATSDVNVSLFTNIGSQGEAYGNTLVSIENLIGGGGNDTFTSGRGVQANSYDGRGGSDTVSYEVSLATSGVVASLTSGLTDVVQTNEAAGDTFTNIENLIGTNATDTLIGNSANNILNGGFSDDLLEGLSGADTFIGGDGIDTVTYAHSGQAAAGAETTGTGLGVIASLTTVFNSGPIVVQTGDAAGDSFSGIENMIGSSFNDTLIGNTAFNNIQGGDGNDILEGMGGNDLIDGGAGLDTASYEHFSTSISASLTPFLNALGISTTYDTLINIENITGSSANDTLIGDAGVNVLKGGDGDDFLIGMDGGDTLDGGAGINTASYGFSSGVGGGVGLTISLLNPATNTGEAAGDSYINIQNIYGTGFNDIITGDNNNNQLFGAAGNDTMIGGLGADQLYGAEGNDNLSDDGVGAAILSGGGDNDVITLTGADTSKDSIDGGTGIDTLVLNHSAIAAQWTITMLNPTNSVSIGWGDSLASMTGVENITAVGDDSLYVMVDNNDNIITGGSSGNDYVEYQYAYTGVKINLDTGVVTGGSGNDTLIGIEYINSGSRYNDYIVGNSADNIFRTGPGGADYIDGGAGVDTWFAEWNTGSVTASLLSATQNTAMGIVMTSDAAGDTVLNIENIRSSVGDFLYGNQGANQIWGRGLLEGFLGADGINGTTTTGATASYANAGNAYLAGQGVTSGASVGVTATLTQTFSVGPAVTNTGDAAGDIYTNIDNLKGSAFADKLIGNANANNIDGGAGDDILEGLGGADILTGGAGIDTVTFEHASVAVTADLAATVTATGDAVGDTYIGIENLTGSNYNDKLYGDAGNNLFDGGLGANVFDGRAGIDTISYQTATSAMTINFANNTATGAGRTDSWSNIERITGSNYLDIITASIGNDWIDPGVGTETIDGLAGNDTISYASATSAQTVVLNTSSGDGKTLSNFENIFGSIYADNLKGDANDNVIEGGLGGDTIDGAAGNDTVSYLYASGGVTVNLTGTSYIIFNLFSANANSSKGADGIDSLSNLENIVGSSYDDILIGNSSDNVINGNDGNDVIVGGLGSDTLTGGNGVDTLSYLLSTASITMTLSGTGTAGDALGDTVSGFENLIGTSYNDTLTGDIGDNVIDGFYGDDTINGAGGIDTITYKLSPSASVTVNLSSTGVNATGGLGSDTLTNFENIIGSDYNDTLTGDGGANVIEGGKGNDTLAGGSGADTVSYINASSAVSVNISTSTVKGVSANSATGGDGTDTLNGFESIIGSAFNDVLIGESGANTIKAGAGNDILIGGAGGDTLDGEAGIDTLSFENATSAVSATLGGATLTHVGDALGDTYANIENITGSAYNDVLYGDNNNNLIIGGAGNDDLRGYGGNDTIDATQGYDQVYGGDGDDLILVSANSFNSSIRYRGEGSTAREYLGGDTIKLGDLVAGNYSLTSLANQVDGVEILNIRDGVNTNLSLSSLDIRNFLDYGNLSRLQVSCEAGDTLNINLAAGETLKVFDVYLGKDYVIFDATNTQVGMVQWQPA